MQPKGEKERLETRFYTLSTQVRRIMEEKRGSERCSDRYFTSRLRREEKEASEAAGGAEKENSHTVFLPTKHQKCRKTRKGTWMSGEGGERREMLPTF